MKNDTFDHYYYQALSELLIELRTKNGRTFEDVALILDLKPNTFWAYEKGTRKMPITVFKKVCLLYNIDMHDALKMVNEKYARLVK